MSLKDYAVNRDKFKVTPNGTQFKPRYNFPCCCCINNDNDERSEPCRTCDHNSNAVKDPPPVQSDQSDEDRREKSESRAGIPSFELRGPTNH